MTQTAPDLARPTTTDRHEMIVDLFAGGGGASSGIFMATGLHPDVAVNHDPQAVALHAMNHPNTRHYCCDVFEVDPVEACSDQHGNQRPVALLWASPDCTHHSKARGGKPAEKKIRALAWVVVKWASKVRPRCIFLENVEEFQDWGPLDQDNRPDKSKRGAIFRLWVSQLEALGYQVAWRELIAADFGAPTTRKRLSLIARCDGRPLVWPQPTHGPRSKSKDRDMFASLLQTWRSAADDVIDWSIPCPSIFRRKKDLAPKTQARIAKGIRRFVIEAAQPFIVPVVNGTWNPDRSWTSAEPLRTVTASRGGDYALVSPTLAGGGIVPITHVGERPVHDLADPLKTVTSANRGELGLVSGTLVPRYGERAGQEPRALDVQAPYPTVVPDGNGGSIAAVHLTKFSENSIGTDPADPLHTAMAGAPRHGLVVAHLGRQFGTAIGRELEDPHPTVMSDGAGGKSYISTAFIDKYYGSGVPSDAADPIDTATAKARFGLAAAFMEQANTGVVGHDARDPVSTLLAAGSHQRPVACEMEPVDGELGSCRAMVVAFLRKHFGEPTAAEVADPTATLMGRLRHGLVMIGKAVWQIADIGMRMLTPRELYNAQGFPRDYIIDRTAKGPLTKTAQTRMAGNSVSPPWAAAIIAANDPLNQREQRAAA